MNVNTHQSLKHDREFNRYYQDVLSQYDIWGEVLRLAKVCQLYDYTEDEFRRLARVFRSIISLPWFMTDLRLILDWS